ncbi:MAG: recombinase family protein [Flammeovirgaceae bacterium]|nr:recombinase family protein [Flammeovirgaceae bacterium]
MKTYAYLRVSTSGQEVAQQRLEIHDYAYKNKIHIDEYIEVKSSSTKSTKDRKLDYLFDKVVKGDTLIVAELSRLGRSLGEIIRLVDMLIKEGVKFRALKENIILNGNQDIQTKVMVTLFGLFAEIERDLISQRTKKGLAAAKAKGKLLGRPKGSLGKSILDGKESYITELLEKQVSKSSIAKILGVSRRALTNFISSRKLA